MRMSQTFHFSTSTWLVFGSGDFFVLGTDPCVVDCWAAPLTFLSNVSSTPLSPGWTLKMSSDWKTRSPLFENHCFTPSPLLSLQTFFTRLVESLSIFSVIVLLIFRYVLEIFCLISLQYHWLLLIFFFYWFGKNGHIYNVMSLLLFTIWCNLIEIFNLYINNSLPNEP